MSSPATARHWVYLDDKKTHEVHAVVQPRPKDVVFSLTEFPAGSRDAIDVVVDERVLGSSAQLDAAMRELEERLAASGTYYRAALPELRWSLVAPPPGARRLDLRAHEVALPGARGPHAKMSVHHFHGGKGGRDRLLVAMPRQDSGEPRSILAQLDFEFPHVAEGKVEVLHTRLSPPTLRSQIAKQHVELPRRGFAKLVEPADYLQAFGANWVERTRRTLERARDRLAGSSPPRSKILSAPQPPPPPEPRALRAALGNARVGALRDRFLPAGQAQRLVESGELGIRRYIQQQRKNVDHQTVFDLSVLESILLVEYGLISNTQALLAEQGPRLLRFAEPSRG